MKRIIDNKKLRYNANSDQIEINANLKIESKIVDSSGNAGKNGDVLSTTETGTAWIAPSGGTQWYSHKLRKTDGASITFVLPFQTSLIKMANTFNGKVFGVVMNVSGAAVGDINPDSTFPILNIDSNNKTISCTTVKTDGTIAKTDVVITTYKFDTVNKYEVA